MTPREYFLNKIMQEANEVAHRASKALEFGLGETEPGQPLTNEERIMEEYADLIGTMALAQNLGIMPTMGEDALLSRMKSKALKIHRYAQYSRECGCLQDDGNFGERIDKA